MDFIREDVLDSYFREFNSRRKVIALCFFFLAVITTAIFYYMPKYYTSSATIYADESNILQPLMAGAAVTTEIEDQARMAQEILFRRKFNDEILIAAGFEIVQLTDIEKLSLIDEIKDETLIENVSFGRASLIRIAHTTTDPIDAYNLTQKYTTLFIDESILNKQGESRDAFGFIENETVSYLAKLVEAEDRLTAFKTEHSEGTLTDANDRVSRYRERIEALELDIYQLETEEASVEEALDGENDVVRDLTEINGIRSRISALQINLDSLRAVYRESYPDIIQLKNQIFDLEALLASEQVNAGLSFGSEPFNQAQGVTTLHQELRSRLAGLKTSLESSASQMNSFKLLLNDELGRVSRITETEAELAELNRDYEITLKFYNDMLSRLESARVSMHLDEEQQGITFIIQDPAIIPLEANGLQFYQLLILSFIFSIAVPIGLLVMYMEFDNKIRTESNWNKDWPTLLMIVPPLRLINEKRMTDKSFIILVISIALVFYGSVYYFNFINQTPVPY